MNKNHAKVVPEPCPDCVAAGIDHAHVAAAQRWCEAKLTEFPVDADLTQLPSERLTEESIRAAVVPRVESDPVVAAAKRDAATLKDGVAVLRAENTTQKTRNTERRKRTPVTAPRSRIEGKPLGKTYLWELLCFWTNWRAIAFVGFTSLFCCILALEYAYQISGLTGSPWELVQEWVGALGICMGFTASALLCTRWLRDVIDEGDAAHRLDRGVARAGAVLAWIGLATMGVLLAALSWDTTAAFPVRCIQAAAAFLGPQLLAVGCLSLERFAHKTFVDACAVTHVENPELEAMDSIDHQSTTQEIGLIAAGSVADSVLRRVDSHVEAAVQTWVNAAQAELRRRELAEQAKNAKRHSVLAELASAEAHREAGLA